MYSINYYDLIDLLLFNSSEDRNYDIINQAYNEYENSAVVAS